ncbi:phosphatase domain-containing protein [uncultured Cyclobacterium sp.]|uniref:phosphatase domain-containing protein n=1 Tax=uncultured Cyclobacterium sp. TaxID=453820 RepID=UPI0030EF279F|tara:strand:- start:43274 stop:44314 length:1041 start_codon:yes stop_codon:yes gene_type:complete
MKYIYLFRWLTWPIRYFFSLIKRKLGKLDLLRVEVFVVLGNSSHLFVKGRVVEAYKQSRPSDRNTTLHNILATLRRYAGSSVPDAKVELTIGSQKKTLITDEEGVFEGLYELNGEVSKSIKAVQLSLLAEEGLKPEVASLTKDILRFENKYPRAIISDIDDTIIVSKATNIQEKFWLSVSKNAYTRRPFPGVSDLYSLLSADGDFPVFYVSSSDWNLFDLIQDFMNYRNIPLGPILLKDRHMNLRNIWKSGGGSHEHKVQKITFLMNFYPELNFVLIGDSGQHDPEIYAEIIGKFKHRVEAVYIRQVGAIDLSREKELNDLLPENKIAWVKNSTEAIDHAKTYLPL